MHLIIGGPFQHVQKRAIFMTFYHQFTTVGKEAYKAPCHVQMGQKCAGYFTNVAADGSRQKSVLSIFLWDFTSVKLALRLYRSPIFANFENVLQFVNKCDYMPSLVQ